MELDGIEAESRAFTEEFTVRDSRDNRPNLPDNMYCIDCVHFKSCFFNHDCRSIQSRCVFNPSKFEEVVVPYNQERR